MKCKMTEKNNMVAMLVIGIVLALVGAAVGYLLPEDAHWQTKAAGMMSGCGSAFAVMAGAILLRRKRLGEKRAADSELTMSDERGIAVAYKAQNVAAIVAILSIIVVMVTALMRGDSLYMVMCVVICFVVAFAKLIAWYVYNRIM